MLDYCHNLNYCFLGCVVITDPYLFQEILSLHPCFMFSKNLVLPPVDKVTTGT